MSVAFFDDSDNAVTATSTTTTVAATTTTSTSTTTTSTTSTTSTTTTTTTTTTLPTPVPPPSDDWAAEPVIGSEPFDSRYRRRNGVARGRLTTLDLGPGHWRNCDAWSSGNVVVAGHRVSKHQVFLRINELVVGDEIIYETDAGRFVYAVTEMHVVEPSDLWIINQTPAYTTTLFACHPRFDRPAIRRLCNAAMTRQQSCVASLLSGVLVAVSMPPWDSGRSICRRCCFRSMRIAGKTGGFWGCCSGFLGSPHCVDVLPTCLVTLLQFCFCMRSPPLFRALTVWESRGTLTR